MPNHFTALNSGSRWHRWEPHVHAPGTVLNDQFKGTDPWESYLQALETATPTIHALGIADYYDTEAYERVCEAKRQGRLPSCDLIFPNIEMRLAVGTIKGRWVNVHLLVSPEDPQHLTELKRVLARLTFEAHEDSYCCSRDDLIRLGQKVEPGQTNQAAAHARGCEQFKVSFDQLREVFTKSTWAQENIVVAVAGGETDGTSGVREGADQTLRTEVEKFAHLIFASSSAQRDFWLGRGVLSEAVIRERYNGPKPCLHGSDAHTNGTVAAPRDDRFSWIKGAVAFDALRQGCIDPGGRAFVANEPPDHATLSQVVAGIEVYDASWARTKTIALNPGLVAIIGARGSGKTALADMIALGCDSTSDRLSQASFLVRAQELLSGSAVKLTWATGQENERELDQSDETLSDDYPHARYLSQKFVEDLCSAQEMTDTLLEEIERVIFEAHPLADRDGTADFGELLDLRATRFRSAREREEDTLADISERIGTDLEKQKMVQDIKKQVTEKKRIIKGYENDRTKLVTKGSETRVARLGALANAAETVRSYLRFFSAQEQSLLSLGDEVGNFRAHQAPEALRRTKERFKQTDIKAENWNPFLLNYSGDVDASVAQHLASSRADAKNWKGIAPPPSANPNAAYIADDADISRLPLATLEAEIQRLEKLISIDRDTANRFTAVSRRITEESTALQRLNLRLAVC